MTDAGDGTYNLTYKALPGAWVLSIRVRVTLALALALVLALTLALALTLTLTLARCSLCCSAPPWCRPRRWSSSMCANPNPSPIHIPTPIPIPIPSPNPNPNQVRDPAEEAEARRKD